MDLPISVLPWITSALKTLNIRYMLVGSFASSIHGRYRATADLDILAEITSEHVGPLYTVLKEAFYVDELAIRRAVAQGGSFNAIHLESVFKVDIFVAANDEFATAQLSRRELRRVAPDQPSEIYVATAEDTILAKLRWYRAGDEVSANQWRDLLGVIEVTQDHLDEEYLREWAERLNVNDLLERAYKDVQTQGL
jgi:hypothetical protein